MPCDYCGEIARVLIKRLQPLTLSRFANAAHEVLRVGGNWRYASFAGYRFRKFLNGVIAGDFVWQRLRSQITGKGPCVLKVLKCSNIFWLSVAVVKCLKYLCVSAFCARFVACAKSFLSNIRFLHPPEEISVLRFYTFNTFVSFWAALLSISWLTVCLLCRLSLTKIVFLQKLYFSLIPPSFSTSLQVNNLRKEKNTHRNGSNSDISAVEPAKMKSLLAQNKFLLCKCIISIFKDLYLYVITFPDYEIFSFGLN